MSATGQNVAVWSPVVAAGAGAELLHAEMQWAGPEATSERSTEMRDIAEIGRAHV